MSKRKYNEDRLKIIDVDLRFTNPFKVQKISIKICDLKFNFSA